MATVFVIDDDESFLKSLTRLLRATGYEVRAYASAKAFLNELTPETTGCAVVDLHMPGLGGLELQDALVKTGNPLPIVFLTGQGDIPSSVSAMRHGAEDFLIKTAPKEQLLAAIGRAMMRDSEQRAGSLRLANLRRKFARLSEREMEVLRHVLSGQLNKQIASAMQISERMVKLHRTSISRKLEVQSVAEIARLAQEAGINPSTGNLP